jgi:hypothetical protein
LSSATAQLERGEPVSREVRKFDHFRRKQEKSAQYPTRVKVHGYYPIKNFTPYQNIFTAYSTLIQEARRGG